MTPGLIFTGNPILANPRGGNIIHGDVSIGAGSGGNLQILQNSHSAIINWDSFSIAAGELTQFRQPGSSAAVLNRVTGGDPSAIHGALQANGNVFVINPNGILVGPSGTIDVHGLVLSTLDVDDGEFLAGGDMTFKGVGENVTNLGRINGVGGDVFLIGRTVTNSGSIRATSGTAATSRREIIAAILKCWPDSAVRSEASPRSAGSGAAGRIVTSRSVTGDVAPAAHISATSGWKLSTPFSSAPERPATSPKLGTGVPTRQWRVRGPPPVTRGIRVTSG